MSSTICVHTGKQYTLHDMYTLIRESNKYYTVLCTVNTFEEFGFKGDTGTKENITIETKFEDIVTLLIEHCTILTDKLVHFRVPKENINSDNSELKEKCIEEAIYKGNILTHYFTVENSSYRGFRRYEREIKIAGLTENNLNHIEQYYTKNNVKYRNIDEIERYCRDNKLNFSRHITMLNELLK